MGVALLLTGVLTLVAASSGGEANVFSVAFGIMMASMGLVVSFTAVKADGGKDGNNKVATTYPLSYAEWELKSHLELAKKTSGNRALGFVLISKALFILTVSGLFGFFFLWPLTLLGVCCVVGGALLCIEK